MATNHLGFLSAEIYHESCRCIEKAALGGRYTLTSSSCKVPVETPPANIDTMVRAAREFGPAFLRQQEQGQHATP